MQLFATFLLLLDFDGPEALDALLVFLYWCVVVAFVLVDFGDAESEEGEWEELECVFKGGTVGDGGEEGVLFAGRFVGW